MRKKLLASILMVCMLFTMLPTTAFAAGGDQKGLVSIDTLMEAEDGTYDANSEHVTYTYDDTKTCAHSKQDSEGHYLEGELSWVKTVTFSGISFDELTDNSKDMTKLKSVIMNGRRNDTSNQFKDSIEVTFENCSFNQKSATLQVYKIMPCNVTKYTFVNCTFDQKAAGQYAITLNASETGYDSRAISYEIIDSAINSDGRGINVTAGTESESLGSYMPSIEIRGNNFTLSAASDSNMAIQIAGNWDSANLTADSNPLITVEQNKIKAYATVRVNDNMEDNKTDSAKYMVRFADNVLAEGTKGAITKPSDTNEITNAIAAYYNARLMGPVAQIGETTYDTLSEAVDAAKDGETITLLRDVTIPKAENSWAILIDKSLVIDGQGKYTITDSNNQRTFRCENKTTTEIDVTFQNVTIINSSKESGPRCIETRNDTINLTLDHVTLKTPTSVNSQPLTIGGDHSNLIDVTIRNSEIVASSIGYAILTFNPSKMLIENSTLTGWAGLYFKGESSSFGSKNADVMVKNCTINSGNIAGAAGGWNNFGAIVFEDNNVKLTLEDTALNVSSFEPNETQEIFSFNKVNAAENGEHVTQNQVFINGADTKVSVEGNMACISESATDNTISITAGHFTSNPSDFLADGKAAVASGRADYPWMVTDATDSIVEPAVGESDVTIPDTIKQEDEKDVKIAAEGVDVQGLAAYASTAAQKSNVEKETATQALTDAKIPNATEANTHVYAQAYLKITPMSYTKPAMDGGESVVPSLTMDITPMYRLVASTTDDPTKIVVQSDGVIDANAVVIPGTQAEKLNISGTVHMVVPMPDGFVSRKGIIFVQHKNYEYAAEVIGSASGKFVAEFDNPHGFSTFTFTMRPTSEAGLNGIGYAKLADAIAAAKHGETIIVMKDGLTADMSGDSRTITLQNGTKGKITVKVNGKDYVLDGENATASVTYTRPSTGGDSYEPSGDYLVSVDKTTGGKVTVNPGRADKGDTVTITVKPDKGYELDSLTVTAKNGDTVKLTEKSGNKFTFKMPGSKVTVEAVFVKEDSEKPVVTLPFADVTTGDWFYDAVAYVYGNDLMNGTSATAFSPYLTTSRAMMLTMLARYDGVDTTTGSTWYEAGAVWAVAEGISDGTNLEADLTREQLVTMLWRYTGSPVVESDLSAYPDGASVSDWAVNAMIWATKTGVITGNGAGALAPQGTATRAEVATILARFCAMER